MLSDCIQLEDPSVPARLVRPLPQPLCVVAHPESCPWVSQAMVLVRSAVLSCWCLFLAKGCLRAASFTALLLGAAEHHAQLGALLLVAFCQKMVLACSAALVPAENLASWGGLQ